MNIANIVVNQTTGICTMRKRIPAGAVGLTVTVHFADPLWDRLEKTVVFRGSNKIEKIADRFDGTTAIIPAEVIAEPGTTLYFGIWGHDPEGILQLPLIEVRLGTTERATQPGSDPEADPDLPIWAKLQQDIEDLKKGGASDEQIAQAVEDYLEKNPIEGGYPTTTEISDESTDEEVPTAAAVRKYVGQHSGGNVDLPEVSEADNGKFLMVSEGVWAAVSLTNVAEVGT